MRYESLYEFFTSLFFSHRQDRSLIVQKAIHLERSFIEFRDEKTLLLFQPKKRDVLKILKIFFASNMMKNEFSGDWFRETTALFASLKPSLVLSSPMIFVLDF